ncbi:hypothetical protein [Botrimarina mediterranea]|uniref:hypothetical protein n=1 Tax=Botrimarina mediterranea TaxID=2528022 RepID=UPI001188C0E0|nr:hypothetical protein K2D_12870 [Planctomycetes bacterium K2D]
MDNLQVTTLCGNQLVVLRFNEQLQKWVAERSCDGAKSPPYACLRTLAEDLADAGHLDHFWEEPLLQSYAPQRAAA